MNSSRRLLVAAVLVFVFLTCLSIAVVAGHTGAFDEAVRSAVHEHASPGLTLLMRIFTDVGPPIVLWPLVAVLLLVLFRRTAWKREIVLISATMVGSLALEVSLKFIFHRPRPMPFFGLRAPESYSYPSGHALYAVCLYGALAYSLARHTRRRLIIWTSAVVMIAMIGLSRVYLGVHYPTDVLAGYAIGFIWLSTTVLILA